MKKTSFLLFVIALFIATIAFSQEEKKEKTRFKLEARFGNASYSSFSSPSAFLSTLDKYNSTFESLVIGIKKYNAGLDLRIDFSGGNIYHATNIKEMNSFFVTGLDFVAYIDITDKFSFSGSMGIDLLLSVSTLNYMNKKYNINTRYGWGGNFGLTLYYKCNEYIYLNSKVSILGGDLKDAKLPTELSSFKEQINNNRISRTEFAVGINYLF